MIRTLSDHQHELRRRLFKVVGAFFLAHALPIAPAIAAPVRAGIAPRTFAAFLDVLLPRDSYSGSASDLKVDLTLREFAKRDPRFRRLVELGCTWLNMTGQGSFADLAATDQIRVVEWMASSDWNQIPRRFYELVRQAAIEIYFSEPASLAGLPIQGPPQPLGHPPPWD